MPGASTTRCTATPCGPEQHFARDGSIEAEHHFEQRRLAASALADNGRHLVSWGIVSVIPSSTRAECGPSY